MAMKYLATCMTIREGKAYAGWNEETMKPLGKIEDFVPKYNNCGADLLVVRSLGTDEKSHLENIGTLKAICQTLELPVAAGGGIETMSDVRRLLYAGAMSVILDGSLPQTPALLKEGAVRFGQKRLMVELKDVDLLFKHKEDVEGSAYALLVQNQKIISSVENLTELPMMAVLEDLNKESAFTLLDQETIFAVGGGILDSFETDMLQLKQEIVDRRKAQDTFHPIFDWNDLKKNSDGLVPCIVQDYQNNQVLMMAYMNEESFNQTLLSGKMTYWSRSRQELWIKGDTSGHYQYVKSLTADCDSDTILAKVSQIGAACHTGSRSCFFKDIQTKYYLENDAHTILQSTFEKVQKLKEHPVVGSYANYLMDHGLDKMIEVIMKEVTDIMLTAKNGKEAELKYEISDLAYVMMVLMVEHNVKLEDVAHELSHRE